MKTIEDVRRALYKAYKEMEKSEDGIEGKSSEAYTEVSYPNWWECNTLEDFLEPCGIMIYSYAIGPSRTHYVQPGPVEKIVNYYTWEGPDIFETAIHMIESWLFEFQGRALTR